MLHKSDLPAFVTVMAWEKRNGSLYYYQSERVEEGRVVKKYLGAGEIAELIAHADETRRRVRQERRERGREELEHLEALTTLVLELDGAAAVLARAHLIADGYHRHKGVWRRERNA